VTGMKQSGEEHLTARQRTRLLQAVNDGSIRPPSSGGRGERAQSRFDRTHVAGPRREQANDRDVETARHLLEPLARAVASAGVAERRQQALGHRADELVVVLALGLQSL